MFWNELPECEFININTCYQRGLTGKNYVDTFRRKIGFGFEFAEGRRKLLLD